MLRRLSHKQFFPKILPKLAMFLVISALAIACFLLITKVNAYFQIKTILLVGNVPKSTIRGLDNLKGLNIYFVSGSFIEKILSQSNPALSLREIVKVYPDKIILKLKFIEPIASLRLNQGYAHLSAEGKVVKKSKSPASPVINFYQKFDYLQVALGNNLDYKEIVAALSLLKKCQDLGLTIESIDINGLSMIVFNLKDDGKEIQEKKILLSAEKNEKKQSFELETIIKQFRIEAKEFKVLDLRFDKPIVKF